MKLKLCKNVHDISLYINGNLYCRCPCAFVAMATLSFHIHVIIMGKVEIGIYFCVTADILTKDLLNVSGVDLYQPYDFFPNRWFWLVATATERLNFRKDKTKKKKKKKHSKIFFSEAIWGMKLKLCIHVHDSSLYKNYVLCCCCCPCAFVAIAT